MVLKAQDGDAHLLQADATMNVVLAVTGHAEAHALAREEGHKPLLARKPSGNKELGACATVSDHVAARGLHDPPVNGVAPHMLALPKRLGCIEKAVISRHKHLGGAKLAYEQLDQVLQLRDGIRAGTKHLALRLGGIPHGVNGVVVDVDNLGVTDEVASSGTVVPIDEVIVAHGNGIGRVSAQRRLARKGRPRLSAVHEHGKAAPKARRSGKGAMRKQGGHADLGLCGKRRLNGSKVDGAPRACLKPVRQLGPDLVTQRVGDDDPRPLASACSPLYLCLVEVNLARDTLDLSPAAEVGLDAGAPPGIERPEIPFLVKVLNGIAGPAKGDVQSVGGLRRDLVSRRAELAVPPVGGIPVGQVLAPDVIRSRPGLRHTVRVLEDAQACAGDKASVAGIELVTPGKA